MAECLCGCGAEVSAGRRFRQGHNLRVRVSKASAEVSGTGVSAGAVENSQAQWGLQGYAAEAPDIPDTRRNMVELGEMGVTGTPIFAGLIIEDFNSKFADVKQALAIYDEMRRTDGTVQAVLLALELPLLQAEWYLEPASQDALDMEIAETLGWNLFEGTTSSFQTLLRQALGMHWAGFSAFEKVFEPKTYNGKSFVGWRKFAPRLQQTVNRWDFDEHGGLRGFYQLAPTSPKEVYIPVWKSLVFTNRQEGSNVQGMSFLRPAYKHWYFKDKLYRLQAIGFERDVVGVPVMKLPPGSGAKDRAKAEEIVKSLRRDENAGAVMKQNWDLELLGVKAAGGNREASILEAIRHHDLKIAQSALAQMINLGEGSRGAYALAVPMSDLMTLAMAAQADYVADAITRYAIHQLVGLNWPGRKSPELKHGDIRKKDLRQTSLVLNALTTAGLLDASPEVLDYIRHYFGLPEREHLDLTPRNQPQVLPQGAGNGNSGNDGQVPSGLPQETFPQAPDALVKQGFAQRQPDALSFLRQSRALLARQELESELAAHPAAGEYRDERAGGGLFDGTTDGAGTAESIGELGTRPN